MIETLVIWTPDPPTGYGAFDQQDEEEVINELIIDDDEGDN